MIYNEGLLGGKTDDLTKQSISYDVGFGQEIQVNTNASEVYTHDIKRDVEEMISCVEDVIKMEDTISTLEKKLASTTDETEKANIQSVLDAANKARSFLEDKMQKTFEAGIAVTQGYLDRANTAMTTIGLVITLLGAGSIAANVMRLIDCIDHPAPRRRRRAA